MSSNSTPPLLLNAMGDFTDMVTLARVAKCSRVAKARLAPLLEAKKSDKEEMYQLVIRLFPGIQDLDHHTERGGRIDADYYNDLLKSYFTPKPRSVPLYCEVVCKIGDIKSKYFYEFHYHMETIRDEMRSAEGRKMLLKAIDEWLPSIERSERSEVTRHAIRRHFEKIQDAVRTDFAVRFDRIITTQHQLYNE